MTCDYFARDKTQPIKTWSWVLLLAAAVVSLASSAESLQSPADNSHRTKTPAALENTSSGWPKFVKAPPGAPNIVLVLLDDVGFGAASVFGGPAKTPALEQLAARGLRYNRFHTTALCSPTRAALLTGRNDHRVGFGTVADAVSAYPGYNGIWQKDTAGIADVLRRNGYSTAAIGKWHNTPMWEISATGPFDRWPTGLGFEFFYGFMGGMDSQWEPSSLYRNTTPAEPSATPEEGYHLTSDIVNEAIAWVHMHESLAPEKPYFLYLATGATHEPHHVPREWIAKYRGHFDQGWDRLRQEVFARQKKLGVIPPDTLLTRRPKELPAWSSLSADQKKLLARQMEVFAAFLAHTDYEVGRLLEVVQRGPQGDNTLIMYIVGDNGASGEAGLMGRDALDALVGPADNMRQSLSRMDELGGEQLMNNYATPWAWATSTPFQWFKHVASHFGGTRAPMIVSWPARIKDYGGLRSQFSHVNDVAATIYEIAGIEFPAHVDGVEQKSLDGTSFAYTFDDAMSPSRHQTQIFEQIGNRAIYHNGWVAAALHYLPWKWPAGAGRAFEEDRWELYHIDEDFSEARDLAAQNPIMLEKLRALFDREARSNDIYPLGAGFGNMGGNSRPSTIANRHDFIYYPDLPRIPGGAVVPDFSQSHRITAEVVIPESGAEGVIIANGSRLGGFALFVKDCYLIYENRFFSEPPNVIASQTVLPRGKVELGYEFTKDEKAGEGAWSSSGVGRIYVNGQLVGEMELGQVMQYGLLRSLGVGRAVGSPMSSAFDGPFKFTGTLKSVRVQLR